MFLEDIPENIPNGKDYFCTFTEETRMFQSVPCIIYKNFATQRYVNGINSVYYFAFQAADTNLFDPDQVNEEVASLWKPNSVIITPILVKKHYNKWRLAYVRGVETRYKLAKQVGKIKQLVAGKRDFDLMEKYMKSVIETLIACDEKIQEEAMTKP